MNAARIEPTLHAAASPEAPATEALARSRDQWPEAPRRTGSMRWIVVLFAVAVAVAVAIALWSIEQRPSTDSQPPVVTTKPSPAPTPDAKPRYPIEASAAAQPLPASDSALLAALQSLWGGGGVASLLEPRELVRNFVATVDNLPRRALPTQKLPVKPAAGSFRTASSSSGVVIAEGNAVRYTPYVRLLESVDTRGLATLYVQNYPAFQKAYQELGYPNGHFNDRLVEAIDVMLAAPESTIALKVVQPKIFYEYADRELEELPAGQKLMLRIGRENAASVKKRLRELRALVTTQAAQPASERSETPATAKAGGH